MIKIYADMRETGTIEALRAMPDVEVVVGALPTGDFVLEGGVVVERKTATDFIASIRDSRVFEQVAKMKASFDRPIVFIDGDPYKTRSEFKPEAIDGVISWMIVVAKVTVIILPNPGHFVRKLHRMAKQAHGDFAQPTLRPGPGVKSPPYALMASYILEGLPGISRVRAQTLLTHFGSVHAVMNASVADICAIKGFGLKLAQPIHNALHWQATGDLDEIPT